MKILLPAAIAALVLAAPMAARACSSCGCTLSSDWDSQGLVAKPGLRLDVRYDYLNQSQLRRGDDAVDRASLPLPQEREIELGTVNRYATFGLDYSRGDWGVNVQAPLVRRTHATYPEGETDLSWSRSSGLGDIRVMARYQGLAENRSVGLQLGVKLPTGARDVRFLAGTEAGEALDRGLQPGTGSTDLLLGVFKFGPLNQDWDYFAQALAQAPIDTRAEFRPGNAINVNLGVRYLGFTRVVPELQLNARQAWRDRGADSDRDNSGGRLVNLSPGLSLRIGERLNGFAFVQVPLYQHVNGLQLAPRYTLSIGARYDLR